MLKNNGHGERAFEFAILRFSLGFWRPFCFIVYLLLFVDSLQLPLADRRE